MLTDTSQIILKNFERSEKLRRGKRVMCVFDNSMHLGASYT